MNARLIQAYANGFHDPREMDPSLNPKGPPSTTGKPLRYQDMTHTSIFIQCIPPDGFLCISTCWKDPNICIGMYVYIPSESGGDWYLKWDYHDTLPVGHDTLPVGPIYTYDPLQPANRYAQVNLTLIHDTPRFVVTTLPNGSILSIEVIDVGQR